MNCNCKKGVQLCEKCKVKEGYDLWTTEQLQRRRKRYFSALFGSIRLLFGFSHRYFWLLLAASVHSLTSQQPLHLLFFLLTFSLFTSDTYKYAQVPPPPLFLIPCPSLPLQPSTSSSFLSPLSLLVSIPLHFIPHTLSLSSTISRNTITRRNGYQY